MLKTKYLQQKQIKLIKTDLNSTFVSNKQLENINKKEISSILSKEFSQMSNKINLSFQHKNTNDSIMTNRQNSQSMNACLSDLSLNKVNKKYYEEKIQQYLSNFPIRKNSNHKVIKNINTTGRLRNKINQKLKVQSKSARLNKSSSEEINHSNRIKQNSSNNSRNYSQKEFLIKKNNLNNQNIQNQPVQLNFQSKNFENKMNLYMNMVIQKSVISHNQKLSKLKQQSINNSNYHMNSNYNNNESISLMLQNSKIYRKSQYLRGLKGKIYMNNRYNHSK